MNVKKIISWLVLGAVGIGCLSAVGQAQDVEVTHPGEMIPWGIDYSVVTESLPAKAGPAAFRLTVSRWEDDKDACDSVLISVTNLQGTPYTGPERWAIPSTEATPYTCVVNVNIPDNDTTAVVIAAGCRGTIRERRWFVTTGDTLEMYAGRPVDSRKYRPSWLDVQRAKFTPEQLKKEFEIRVDLRRDVAGRSDRARKLLGSLEPTDTAGVYLVRVTLDVMLILEDWGVWFAPLDYEAVRQEYPPSPEDPLRDSSESGNSLKSQSLLHNQYDSRGQGVITLERVTGLSGGNTLPINETITYYLRLNNNTGSSIRGITNGFRVYSPDGADWTETVGDTHGTNIS